MESKFSCQLIRRATIGRLSDRSVALNRQKHLENQAGPFAWLITTGYEMGVGFGDKEWYGS